MPLQLLLEIAAARRRLGMQAIPALDLDALPGQLGVTGRAPNIGRNGKIRFEYLRGGQHFTQNGTAPEKLNPGRRSLCLAHPVDPPQNALSGSLGHRRLRVLLVHQRDVIEDVLLLGEHPSQPLLDDHGHFVRVGGIVGHAARNQRRLHVTVSVLVLKTLSVESRPPRSAPEQKAPSPGVPGEPGQISDTLKAEHRIVDIEGDHVDPVICVSGSCREPRRECARFGNPLLENLAVLLLAVIGNLVRIHGFVELAHRGINGQAAEHGLHAESTRFVGHDGHDILADLLIPAQQL